MQQKMIIPLLAALALLACGCSRQRAGAQAEVREDGSYRGAFIDGDSIQVNVEFTLKGGVVTSASFRHLRADENYHLNTDVEPYRSVIQQYQEILAHLVGKDLDAHLSDLHDPEAIVTTEVDGHTAATLRSSKIISAVRDALNRGVYSY